MIVLLIAFLAPLAGWLSIFYLFDYLWQEQEWKAQVAYFDKLTWKHDYYEETGELWQTWAELPAIGREAHGQETSTEETH